MANPTEVAPLPFNLSLSVHYDENIPVLDLSGDIPFKFSLNVSRRKANFDNVRHSQPVDILTDHTVLRLPDALWDGQLQIGLVGESRHDIVSYIKPDQYPRSVPDWDEPHVVRLGSGVKYHIQNPQKIEYTISPDMLPSLEDGAIYRIRSGPKRPKDQTHWNGGITWWKLCADKTQACDLTQPGEANEPRLRESGLVLFKAMANLPRPPRFEYEARFSPTSISLSKPQALKCSVSITSRETDTYTILSSPVGSFTVFFEKLSLTKLVVVDLDNNEVLSGPLISASRPGEPWGGKPYLRTAFTEIGPLQTNHRAWTCDADEQNEMLPQGLRLRDLQMLIGRRLGLRLRPMTSWWAGKSIDELFGAEELVKRDLYTIPLEIKSEQYVPFEVVA